jgi:Zn-dependent protease with chaperone function
MRTLDLPRRRSLALSALGAAALVVCSYAFTVLLSAACVVGPLLLLTYLPGTAAAILFIAGVVMAGVILWSIVPRRDRFQPVGKSIRAADQGRLFSEIENIAVSLKERLPSEVYLTLDVNAAVADRGGVMGVGSRRVMLLGLPLIRVLTVSQLRAVLAHEFGHYYTGDTRLLPWVYRTRGAMIRAIQNLGSESLAPIFARIGWASVAHTVTISILAAYWKLFMRVSQAISRRQEYRADELACHIAGSQALIDGLRRIHSAAAAAPWFWQNEISPAVKAGCRPPIAVGFAHFMAAPRISKLLAEELAAELRKDSTHPYDTHPALGKRLAAAEAISYQCELDESPAITLLDNVDGLEVELLKAQFPKLDLARLTPVSWDRIGSDVYIPAWRRFVAEHASALPVRMEEFPRAAASLGEIGRKIPDPPGMLLTPEQRAGRAAFLLGEALALALWDAGWQLCSKPGEFQFERNGEQIDPAALIAGLRSGQVSPAAWAEWCRSAGLSSDAASA